MEKVFQGHGYPSMHTEIEKDGPKNLPLGVEMSVLGLCLT